MDQVSFAVGPEFVTDFNGDQNPDLVLSKTGSGETGIWYLKGASFLNGVYGPTLPSGWTIASTEDWNADGKPDFLVFNAGTGQTGIW